MTFCTKSGAFSETSDGAHRTGHRDLVQMRECLIYGLKVPAYHVRSHLAVGLLDRLLDLGDRLLAQQYVRDRKIAGLHDRVDAAAHAGFLCHGVSIDGEEADSFLDHLLLQFARQALPHAVRPSRNIQQKHRAGSETTHRPKIYPGQACGAYRENTDLAGLRYG